MTESGFLELKSKTFRLLTEKLNPNLTYHSPSHTEDVLNQAERIAALENIKDLHALMLIRIAALFHDTGFIRTYKGHEEQSCLILRDMLGPGELSEEDFLTIRGMIMATKLPQRPVTMSEKIICDADLDYLGRSDFIETSELLKQEFLTYGIVKDELDWDRLQVSFFENHQYFTETSRKERCPVKKQHHAFLIRKLKERELKHNKLL